MSEQGIDRWLERAKEHLAFAEQTLQTNKAAVIPVPYESAENHLNKAQQLLSDAQNLSSSEEAAAIELAKMASEEGLKAYLLSLPSRVAEARGVWYRPIEKNLAEVRRTMDRIQAAGFNELYLETWFWGYTIFPSRTAKAHGIDHQHPNFLGWDPLEAFVSEAEIRGIAVHAWLDGFMVGVDPSGGPQLRMYPEWAARTRRQAKAKSPEPDPETGYYWLDLTNPEVSGYFIVIVKEILSTYRVAGINLDFMRFPQSTSFEHRYGFSGHARRAFAREIGVDPLHLEEQSPLWSTWQRWLEQREDEVVAALYAKVKSVSSQLIVSAAPEPGVESDKIANWSQYVDIVIPQAYHDHPMEVRKTVEHYLTTLPSSNLVYSGIYPMYIHLGAQETVEHVQAARELVGGTVVFAMGQATDETIAALRLGPWRNPAISTGMHPIRAVQAELEAVKIDITECYVPRGGLQTNAAIAIMTLLDDLIEALKLETDALRFKSFNELATVLLQYLKNSEDSASIHGAVLLQLKQRLAQIHNVVHYAKTKQIM